MPDCLIRACLYRQYVSERISHFFSSKFSSNVKLFLIKNDKIHSVKLKYFLCKIPGLRYFSNKSGDFYCIIHNSYGINKTILKNTNILDIIKMKNEINIIDKTDNSYISKILEEIKLIKDNGKEYNLTNTLTNIDKSLDLTVGDFLKLHKIKYTENDTINLKIIDCMTFEEIFISEPIHKYIGQKINELI